MIRIINVTRFLCVQRYLDDHRRRAKFTRWELARRPGRRPNQWLVLCNLRPHENTG